jgi:hypothetical protein
MRAADMSAALLNPRFEDSGAPATLVLPNGEVASRLQPPVPPKFNKFLLTDGLLLYNFRSVRPFRMQATTFVRRHGRAAAA